MSSNHKPAAAPLVRGDKSDHLITVHQTHALRSSHPEVRRLKRRNSHHAAHGNKVWRSSFVLMDYFLEHPLPDNVKVMDLGCGWGLCGIFLSKHYQARVTGIDIDAGVQPFLNLQAAINDCQIDFQAMSFERVTRRQLAPFHTLIGADICFWSELTPVLYKLIGRACKAGVKQICIADPGRRPFWDLVEHCQHRWESVHIERRIDSPCPTTKHILIVDLSRPAVTTFAPPSR